jgi:hypothetical protein
MSGKDPFGQSSQHEMLIAKFKERNLLVELMDYALQCAPLKLSRYSVAVRKGPCSHLFDNPTLYLISRDYLYVLSHDVNTGDIVSDTKVFDPNDSFFASIKREAVPLQLLYKDELTKGLEGLDEDENQESN